VVELETELAKKPDLYLVLDPAASSLEVRARGLALATIPVEEISVLAFRPLFGGKSPGSLEAPAIWTVRQGPGDTDRETIAPTTLREYSQEDEMEEGAGSAAPEPGADGEEETTPSRYRVGLDNGWQLYLVDERPRLGWIRRFFASIRDGWQRLRGEEPEHPPLVALVVAAEDARRLHRVFRTERKILVKPAG